MLKKLYGLYQKDEVRLGIGHRAYLTFLRTAIDDHDDLEHEDILAALLFAARLTQVKSIYRVLV